MRLSVDSTGHLLGAQQQSSPNQDERPPNTAIDLLVIHNISLPPGQFGGPWIEQFFQNTLEASADPFFTEIQGLTVSAHLLLRRDGRLIQFVPFSKRAWHAGVSQHSGRCRCNDFSIGIEVEGTDHCPYENVQYQQLQRICRVLMQAYPAITKANIVGHCDIAPGRKTDPGPTFDWKRLRQNLAECSGDKS